MRASGYVAVVAASLMSMGAYAQTQTVQAGAPATTTAQPLDGKAVESMVGNWPQNVKDAIFETMKRYGPPDEIGIHEAIWHNVDMSDAKMNPFKHAHIMKMEAKHDFPMSHTDFYRQVINYRVPVNRMDELTAFDGSVVYDRTRGELSVTCNAEPMNILAFNLAHDVATGKRTVEDVRRFYAETAKAFKAGETPDYTQRPMFDVPKEGTADPDRAFN